MIGIPILMSTSAIAILLLIIHSYFLRGPRVTFNFFFFAFLWAFMKEVHAPRSPIIFPVPYEFLDLKVPMGVSQLTASIGWVFAFYLSWCLAELILKRIDYYKDRLFAVLLLSVIIIGSISYCMETPAIAVGWWKWKAVDLFLANFLILCPFLAIFAWMSFGMHFLVAFFLIELSRYKDASWKCIFFLLPAVHIWIMRFLGGKKPVEMEGAIALFILIILAFLSRLRIEYGRVEDALENDLSPIKNRLFSFIYWIPVAMALFMVLIALILELAVAKNPVLVISLLPVLLFVVLSIKKIPFIIPFILSAIGVVFTKLFPLTIISFFIFLFWVISKLKIKKTSNL